MWRILHRLDLGRLPTSQRPEHQVQIDVEFVEPLPVAGKHGIKPELKPIGRRGKFYQFTAIDDCTRLRIIKIYPPLNQKTTIQFLDYLLSQLPFAVEKIQTEGLPRVWLTP